MRGKLIPFTEEDKINIVNKYSSGARVRTLAQEYHCSDARIKTVLEVAGFRLQGAEFTGGHLRDIADRYAAGEDVLDIAKAYRCRFYTMRDLIKSLKLEPRVITTTNTPIECRLHDVLRKYGIGFTTQVRLVNRYVVDIKINQSPVVIEADGKTYHKNKRDEERDLRHEQAGFRVFRFTGSEINTDAESCIRHVVDDCGLTPDKNPVYDVRTSFRGADHPRWNRVTLICLNCSDKFSVMGKHKDRKFCAQACYHDYVRRTGIFKGGRKAIERPD